MKTLLTSYRVRELDRSLAFYTTLGFREIGRVALDGGATLVMLNLPGDGEEVTLELAHEPNGEPLVVGNGFSHIAVQVDDLAAFAAALTPAGIAVDGPHLPGGGEGPKTAFVHDPDGYRLEFVQWPAGHPAEMTRADFAG